MKKPSPSSKTLVLRIAAADVIYGAAVTTLFLSPVFRCAAVRCARRSLRAALGSVIGPRRSFRSYVEHGSVRGIAAYLKKDPALASAPLKFMEGRSRYPLEWAVLFNKDGSHAGVVETLLPHSARNAVINALDAARENEQTEIAGLLERHLETGMKRLLPRGPCGK